MISSSVRIQDAASQQVGSVMATTTVAIIPTNGIAVSGLIVFHIAIISYLIAKCIS